jgi:hypothetical protein
MKGEEQEKARKFRRLCVILAFLLIGAIGRIMGCIACVMYGA